ncbi:MAG: NTP transferase domain-containing protein, partial [Proteobacteria bacterium]|nr:NTP transferase domain-containing protein [Pseudomonadota bacterium]
MKLEVVVLAAGKGTRMRSALPKVLHLVAGRPMLSHVLESAQKLSPDHIHVVCGHGAAQVREYFSHDPTINWIFQAEQMGTGHAVCQALPDISTQSTVLVLYGDIPLILPGTLQRLTDEARDGSLALLSASFDNPHGYGRVVRDS